MVPSDEMKRFFSVGHPEKTQKLEQDDDLLVTFSGVKQEERGMDSPLAQLPISHVSMREVHGEYNLTRNNTIS